MRRREDRARNTRAKRGATRRGCAWASDDCNTRPARTPHQRIGGAGDWAGARLALGPSASNELDVPDGPGEDKRADVVALRIIRQDEEPDVVRPIVERCPDQQLVVEKRDRHLATAAGGLDRRVVL